ncbi:MAG: T9SS type A sorting domain-containing protein [Candidatus Latescibacteria bacterium]|nr:T9SS type A sorting domain-containing protein [Candidatus Latescibacterota bacterium]
MQGRRLLRCWLGVFGALLGLGSAGAEALHDDGPGTFKGMDIDALDNFQPFAPFNMELMGQLPLGDVGRITEPINTDQGVLATSDLAVAGGYVYMGGFDHALHIVDIAEPTQMRQVARVETPAAVWDIKVAGDLAALGVQSHSSNFGLVLVDISDPTAPQIWSQLQALGWRGVHNIYLDQQRAYLAHSVVLTADRTGLGISVVDISDPAAPFISGGWQHASFSNVVHDIFIRDDIGYASDFFSGLALLDLADPDNPRTLASLPIAEGTHSAFSTGQYVYFNQEFGGWGRPLRVADITHPEEPRQLDVFRPQQTPQRTIVGPHNPFVQDGLLYWAYYDAGVRIFDLADPEKPVEIGYYPSAQAWGAQPHGDGLVYVADSFAGLLALRFVEPAWAVRGVEWDGAWAGWELALRIATQASPRQVAGEAVQADIWLVEVATDQRLHLGAIDAVEAASGQIVGRVDIPAEVEEGMYRLLVYLSDERGSIYPYEVPIAVARANTAVIESAQDHQAGGFALGQNYPNPFNSETTIVFTLSEAASIDLGIFDMAGQRVATLSQGSRLGGTYQVRWDGRRADGGHLASGLYVYRLRTGDRVEARKLLLLQ